MFSRSDCCKQYQCKAETSFFQLQNLKSLHKSLYLSFCLPYPADG